MLARYWIVCSGLILVVSGCGQAPPPTPTLLTVSGKVLMDGKPLDGCMVTFMPRGDTKGQMAYGVTGENGDFDLKYATGDSGCPEGEYKAIFSKLRMADGQPIPEGKTAADVSAVEKVPRAYRMMDNELNVIRVTSDGRTDLKFELKSR